MSTRSVVQPKKPVRQSVSGRTPRAKVEGKPPKRVGIFISYSKENESLARKLKDKLEGLEDKIRLEVFIAAELGGKNWRATIRERLASADILILPYTSSNMKLDWCCYELGRFDANERGHPVCIMNTHLTEPPSQLAEWQGYRADRTGLRKFFLDLFMRGQFTKEHPLNCRLVSDEGFSKRLDEAVTDIEAEFAAFRVEERFYTYRVVISSPNVGQLPSTLSFDTARVHGDRRTLDILGVEDDAEWKTVRESCQRHSSTKWLDQIERLGRLVPERRIVQTLVPFKAAGMGVYIPVISRIESVERKASRLYVIFVEIGRNQRIGLEHFGGFDLMPVQWKAVFSLLEIARRFRWDGLELAYGALKYPASDAPEDQWKSDAQQLLSSIKEAEQSAIDAGFGTPAQFFGAFDSAIKADIDAVLAPYMPALERLKLSVAGENPNREGAFDAIVTIREVNTSFLRILSRQLGRLVDQLAELT